MEAIRLFERKKPMTRGTSVPKSMMFNYHESKEELLKTILTGFSDELSECIECNADKNARNEQEKELINKYFEMIMKL